MGLVLVIEVPTQLTRDCAAPGDVYTTDTCTASRCVYTTVYGRGCAAPGLDYTTSTLPSEACATPRGVYTTEACAAPRRVYTTGACATLGDVYATDACAGVVSLQGPQLHLDAST
jgi:hypothetical protein